MLTHILTASIFIFFAFSLRLGIQTLRDRQIKKRWEKMKTCAGKQNQICPDGCSCHAKP